MAKLVRNKRKLIQSTLRSIRQYQLLLRALKNRPKHPAIPCVPSVCYEQFINWGDWLGTGKHMGGFLPYKEAREFVRKLNLKSRSEWYKWWKHNKPSNIPSNPRSVYKEWKDWGDWLGTGRHYGAFLPFEEAREFVRKLNLKSLKEWRQWCKHKPSNIPSSPQNVYKEWKDWGDWLGTWRHKGKCEFLPYKKAREFVRKLNLKSYREWQKWCKHRPPNIPSNPNAVYKEWKNWGDWLGTGKHMGGFLPYKEAREFAQKLKLKSSKEWKKWCKHSRPPNIPSNPNVHYKEWVDWEDWLGTRRHKSKFLPFEEAREFVRKLKLKSFKEWRQWCKHSRPPNIPSAPNEHYKEWQDWGDWIGTKNYIAEERLIIGDVEKAA